MKRIIQASGFLAVLWCIQTALALTPAALVSRRVPAPPEPGAGLFLEALFDRAPHLAGMTTSLTIAALLTALLAPGLLMAWLAALERARPTAEALLVGARLYGRAVAARIVLWIPVVVALVATLVFLATGDDALPYFDHNERSRDLTYAGLLGVVFAPSVPLWCAWHDLTHAALLRTRYRGLAHDVFEALYRGFRALNVSAVCGYLGWWFVAVGLGAAALLVASTLADGGALAAIGVLVATQMAHVGRLVTRSAWLSAATTRAQTST